MNLLRSIQLRRAARRWAHELRPQLRRDYGAGGEYTAAQIRSAALKVGFRERHLPLAYAALMTREAFLSHVPAGRATDYDVLRSMFLRYAGWATWRGGAAQDSVGAADTWLGAHAGPESHSAD
jgi:hypothetical protein